MKNLARPMYRFCLRQNGDLFSLFSVKENSDGTLAVYTSTEDSHEGFSEGFETKKLFRETGSASQRKFSVHPSIGRDGITITCQVVLNSEKFRSKLLVDSDLPNLIARVCTYLCPIMNERSLVDLKTRKGTLVEIANLSRDDKTSIIYSIVVTGKFCPPTAIPGFCRTEFEFEYFNLNIYLSYLNFPAADVSVMNSQMTFSPQIDSKPTGSMNMIKSPNEELRFLPDLVRQSAFRVANRAIDIYVRRYPLLASIKDIPLYFHPSLDALRKGRAARGF